MNKYLLTLVLAEKTTPAKKKSIEDKIENILVSLKGKLIKSDEWGKIDLAYKIRKESAGFFIEIEIELEAKDTKGLKDKLKIESDIIRYLLVRKD
ncbi:30S ribosomal protein S6 [Candidatus Woesebacteria bacterium RBG_13_34_9]|uniref:Small ribosomal subunit protein bS6 n=1 Tax=Candidatus Woesebacteria bacterium RBG_13_34_9 TaxID=1802477 RepID=A0A1F7X0P7_9BACT|nr:MAG: 30S ribosomal protein S6 [Candidatus Woesebacteria bacterium RBG_13_34_9]